jgi:DNA primase
MNSPEGKADLIRQAMPLLEQIAAPALGLIIKKRLAELAGVDVDEFDMLMGHKKPERKGRREYRVPTGSVRPVQMSIVRRQLKWLLMNPYWADDVQLPDSLTLSDELACFAMLSERAKEHGTAPTTAQLLESIRGTPYEALVDNVLQQAMQDPEEFAAPNDDDRLQFQDGNQKLLRLLREAELERLKQKSRSERLTPEESQLMRELVSRKV